MLSKETAVIAPFLVLLAEYGVLRHGREIVRHKIDLFMLSVPALVAGLIVLDIVSGAGPLSEAFLPGYENRDFTLTERLLTQPRVIGLHFSQILWPLPGHFSLEHDLPVSTGLLTPVSTLVSFLGVVSWCAAGIWLLFRPTLRIVGFFLLWIPATLVIESTIVPLEMVFEHRMYLPTVGLAGIAAVAIAWPLQHAPRLVPLTLAACCAVIVLLSFSSGQQVVVWKSTLSLAQNSVENAPNSARAWGTLANALKEDGHGWDRVMPPMMRALALDPKEKLALHLRAIQLIEKRRLDDAEEILEALAPRAASDHSILNTIGMLRFEQGNLPAAIRRFDQAVKLNGFVPEFKYNLALSYEHSGRCHDAQVTWLSYLQSETHERRLSMVRERLKKNFDTEGGRCFGID